MLTHDGDICIVVIWSPYFKIEIDVDRETFLKHLRESLQTAKETRM